MDKLRELMARNVTCLRIQRGWSKLIRVQLLYNELVKLIMRSFGMWAFWKLGIAEWLIKIAQSRYRSVQVGLRVNGTFSNDFLVQVGLYLGGV